MRSFLLVSPRHGQTIAAAEHRDFLTAAGLEPEELDLVMIDTAQAELPDLSGYDGIFVGGSPFNISSPEYGEEQLHVHELLAELIDSKTPVMFVCFGNGLIAHLDGGAVGHTHPESAGPTTVEITPLGALDPLLRDIPQTFTALTGHTENVTVVGAHSVVLATGETCPVQMVRANDTTWACQFHADMDAIAMKNRMDFYKDYGYFSPEAYDSIVSSLPEIDTTHANQILRNFVRYCTT